jgi:hypothetical protein
MTGIELIATERQEQIDKHGWSLEHDAKFYEHQELLVAAQFCLAQPDSELWPAGWDEHFKQKIKQKDRIGQLKVAGAFIAAEIDRLQTQQ